MQRITKKLHVQVWKMTATDLCEVARNSVLHSGFPHQARVRRCIPPCIIKSRTAMLRATIKSANASCTMRLPGTHAP